MTTDRCGLRMSCEERLVHPGAADGAAGVADDRVEDLEAAPARDREVRALDLAEHRRPHPRAKRCDRLHVAAVFVAERKPVEEILDGDEAGAFEVRGFPRTYALQKLKRGVEDVVKAQFPTANAQRSRTLGILH